MVTSVSDDELSRLQSVTGVGLPSTIADLTLLELKSLVSNPSGALLSVADYKAALAVLPPQQGVSLVSVDNRITGASLPSTFVFETPVDAEIDDIIIFQATQDGGTVFTVTPPAGFSVMLPHTAFNNASAIMYMGKHDGRTSYTFTTSLVSAAARCFWLRGIDSIGIPGVVGTRGGVSGTQVTAPAIAAGHALGLFCERTVASPDDVTALSSGEVLAFAQGMYGGGGTGIVSATLVDLDTGDSAVTATWGVSSGNAMGVLFPVTLA